MGKPDDFVILCSRARVAFLICIYPQEEIQPAEAIRFKLSPVIDVIVRIG
jgi:hypothetical protein